MASPPDLLFAIFGIAMVAAGGVAVWLKRPIGDWYFESMLKQRPDAAGATPDAWHTFVVVFGVILIVTGTLTLAVYMVGSFPVLKPAVRPALVAFMAGTVALGAVMIAKFNAIGDWSYNRQKTHPNGTGIASRTGNRAAAIVTGLLAIASGILGLWTTLNP